MLDVLIKLGAVGVFAVGVVTLASPWLRGADRQQNPLPPRGWTCWDVTRSTTEGRSRGHHCEPALGWHLEESVIAGGRVAVPDDARVVRRYPVRD
jgi:hypothetical protein